MRLVWSFSFSLLVVSLAGCDKQKAPAPPIESSLAKSFQSGAERSDADNVLVITPFSKNTSQLYQAMRDELMDDIDLFTFEMSDQVDARAIERKVREKKARCVVLVGNRAARAYAEYQKDAPSAPPAVVLMASFAQEMVDQLRSGMGIAYEVPGVTSFVALRALFDRPAERVGVLYRPKLGQFMKKQVELAKMEKVEVVTREIDGEPGPRKIRLALRQLLDKEKVDAIWVLNDNKLLSEANLRGGWLPELRGVELPVIVGVSSLVNTQLRFGSVAVVPDHEALGVQAANMIFDLWDEEWSIERNRVDMPLSVQTVVDMKQAASLELLPDANAHIDRSIF